MYNLFCFNEVPLGGMNDYMGQVQYKEIEQLEQLEQGDYNNDTY